MGISAGMKTAMPSWQMFLEKPGTSVFLPFTRRQTFTCMLILARGERRLSRVLPEAVLAFWTCINISFSLLNYTGPHLACFVIRLCMAAQRLSAVCTKRPLDQSYPGNHLTKSQTTQRRLQANVWNLQGEHRRGRS